MKATTQIFLSYARQDEEKVEKLYQELSDAGFKPWMDKKDILPGERWASSIQRAIRDSDFFLVCLSTNSVKKRGWVQREMKQALDLWQEKLDSDIYLIPVRLEDCEVPESLCDFQWLDLFEEDGWTRLRKAIQVGMERRTGVPDDKELLPLSALGFDSPRLPVLWRLAYAFLRLDQLPPGAWGKGLYSWMEAIWKGDRGTVSRLGDTRAKGGTDLTTYTFYYYYLFLSKILPPAQVVQLLQKNGTAQRVYDNFQARIDIHGAFGSRWTPKGGTAPEVRVRHTLMGFITLLLYGKASRFLHIQDSLSKTPNYLVKNIPKWRHDQDHLFAMTGAAVKLQEMLRQDIAHKQLSAKQIEELQAVLARYIPQMMGATNAPLQYNPRPPGTIQGPLQGSMFRPYYDFWRMERSNFVMYFPFFVTDDGLAFLLGVSDGIRWRCAQIFAELLKDIALPYDGSTPYKHLVCYHRSPGGTSGSEAESPRDWGLSAELAVLLQMDAVRELLIQDQQVSAESYDQKRSALNHALVDTFDAYSKCRELFEFTHGPSFGRILHLFEKEQIKPAELERLDEALSYLCAEGVTEAGLAQLIREYIVPAAETTAVDQRALRDLMITKLESGEHTPDDKGICNITKWQQKVHAVVNSSTIAFYESELGDKHVERYAEDPQRILISVIQYGFGRPAAEKRIALDVGCGAGQYAELLAQLGFEVKLLDASPKMLRLACARLGLGPKAFTPVNIFDASWGYPDEYFDLIFASAIMIHVPEDKRDHVYSAFRRLLKQDGLLFVSYKIGDHTLISEDGRFFAYYRDEAKPRQELEYYGFRIEIELLNYKFDNKDMYLVPKPIQWANFYCFKR